MFYSGANNISTFPAWSEVFGGIIFADIFLGEIFFKFYSDFLGVSLFYGLLAVLNMYRPDRARGGNRQC